MIQITRLNHSSIVLNADMIEHIETTPDTVITLTTGQTIMVLESVDEVVKRVVAFRRMIMAPDAASLTRPLGAPAAGQEK